MPDFRHFGETSIGSPLVFSKYLFIFIRVCILWIFFTLELDIIQKSPTSFNFPQMKWKRTDRGQKAAEEIVSPSVSWWAAARNFFPGQAACRVPVWWSVLPAQSSDCTRSLTTSLKLRHSETAAAHLRRCSCRFSELNWVSGSVSTSRASRLSRCLIRANLQQPDNIRPRWSGCRASAASLSQGKPARCSSATSNWATGNVMQQPATREQIKVSFYHISKSNNENKVSFPKS